MEPHRLSGDGRAARQWCDRVAAGVGQSQLLLLLAGTETAAVAGISAAGSTPEARRFTAAADAELLLLGPAAPRPHALPPLPAGVSPALIAWTVVQALALDPLVLDLGVPVAPAVPHLRLGQGPARCLSTGAALPLERVERLLGLGRRWGARLARGPAGSQAPLLLAECVPGGTSTAQAVLQGLGIEAAGLVSGSLREPAHALKQRLVAQGLASAGVLAGAVTPERLLAAVGDPMQAVATGLVLAAAEAGLPVLLAGGSQMAAVLALALALASPLQRPAVARHVAIATTAWVAEEASSNLSLLLQQIADRWQQEPLAFAASLRFGHCQAQVLRDYERGYVKEGVGAGGLALLWELSGRSAEALASACDEAWRLMSGGGDP